MDAGLREDLEIACLDEMRGDPPGPGLAGRLVRVVRELLMRRGLGSAQVSAQSDRRGTSVTILLPTPGKTVQRVVLTLGGSTGP